MGTVSAGPKAMKRGWQVDCTISCGGHFRPNGRLGFFYAAWLGAFLQEPNQAQGEITPTTAAKGRRRREIVLAARLGEPKDPQGRTVCPTGLSGLFPIAGGELARFW